MTRDCFFLRSSTILLVLASLGIVGCGGGTPVSKPKDAPRVTVAHPVTRSLLDEDDYNGWLEAFKTVEVRSRVRGHIIKVHFNDGDFVKVGQPLFDLDSAPFEVELKQCEAQAKAFQAQEVAATKVWERNKILVKTNAVSQQDLEKSEADAAAFAAQIMAKRAEAERHQLDIKYSHITAELAGKIGKAALVEGALVNAGGSDPLLTTIVAIDPIYVDFNVDERAIQRYQNADTGRKESDKAQTLRAQKISFSFGLDTEQGFPHQGQIVFADIKYQEGTGTILMRGVTQNPEGRLVPGSRVRVRIPVSDKYDAPIVPDSAILSDQDRRYLLVLGKDNVVLRRNITPGRLLDDGMRVILPSSGEENVADKKQWVKGWEQEWVVTVGLQRARINDPVQPMDSQGQPVVTTAPAK